MAQRLGDILKQQVVVENIGGAGGMTGAERVAQAKPDGYEMLLGTVGTQAYSQTLYKKPLYNAVTDFAPVALVAEQPLVLVVRKDLPVNSLKNSRLTSRRTPRSCRSAPAAPVRRRISAACCSTRASASTCSMCPIAARRRRLQDLMAGRIDYLCDAVSTELAPIKAGSVKPIAVLARQRSAVLPALPTAQQEGFKGFEANNWIAPVLPAQHARADRPSPA